jgi:hypothetical protein
LALGRKSFLFSGNHAAAQNTAILYSFMGTCKANEVNPGHQWLEVALEKLSYCTSQDDYSGLLRQNFMEVWLVGWIPFNDSLPSIPRGMATSRWGALASFGARTYPWTKKQYSTFGNSFVAVVEFGDSVKAKITLAGGQSGTTNAPHFDDQAQLYAGAQFKTVAFYREAVLKRATSRYHPGEEK